MRRLTDHARFWFKLVAIVAVAFVLQFLISPRGARALILDLQISHAKSLDDVQTLYLPSIGLRPFCATTQPTTREVACEK